MFELISGGPRHPFHQPTALPTVISLLGHGVVIATVAGLSFYAASDVIPEVPTIMAFVAAAPEAPPPPPPAPPPAAKAQREPPKAMRPTPVPGPAAAPVEAPAEVRPEPIAEEGEEEGWDVEGGVAGGVVGGVPGGIVGGLIAEPPPPPPPPPPAPPARRGPVRIGGKIEAPALVHRVDPIYPDIAAVAKVTGVVILEATVDADGAVESVKVLRSVKLLDSAAIAAVKQWRYSPLVLNGVATPFVLTVTLTFSIK
jgi:protein TonB